MKDARHYITKSRSGHYSITAVHLPSGMRVTYSKLELDGAKARIAEAMQELEQRVGAYRVRLAEHDRKVRAEQVVAPQVEAPVVPPSGTKSERVRAIPAAKRAAGHKLLSHLRGKVVKFGVCQCGWESPGFTTSAGENVRASYRLHIEDVTRTGARWAGANIPKPADQHCGEPPVAAPAGTSLPYAVGTLYSNCTDLVEVATAEVIHGFQVFEQRRVADGTLTGRKSFVNGAGVLCGLFLARFAREDARQQAIPALVAALRDLVAENPSAKSIMNAHAALFAAEGVA